MSEIDRLSYMSRLRGINEGEKALFCFGSMAAVLSAREFSLAAAVALINSILIVGIGKTPFRVYVKLLLVPLFFIVCTAAVFVPQLHLFPLSLSVSRSGIMDAVQTGSVSFSCVTCLFAMTLSTPVSHITALMRRLHVPDLFTELMLFMYRSVFIMWDTARSIRRSAYARMGDRTGRTALRTFVMLIPRIFVLSIRRAMLLYDAMEARGYDGGAMRVLSAERPVCALRVCLIVLYVGVLLVARLFL